MGFLHQVIKKLHQKGQKLDEVFGKLHQKSQLLHHLIKKSDEVFKVW